MKKRPAGRRSGGPSKGKECVCCVLVWRLGAMVGALGRSLSRESTPKLPADAASPASVLRMTKKIKIASTSLPPAQKTNPRWLCRRMSAAVEAMHPGLFEPGARFAPDGL